MDKAVNKRKYEADIAFTLAHSLSKQGLRNIDIAKTLGYSAAAISNWLDYKTREEYLKASQARLAEYNKKEKGNGKSQLKKEAISSDLSPVIDQLNTIIAVLKAIEFKLDVQ